MAVETPEQVIQGAVEGMEKALQSLRHDLQRVRTGRANAALLDGVMVDYYGTPTPLNQLANLTVPDPRLIVIAPYDKGALHAIEKAIQTAQHLGLSPNNDGKVVRIPIPALTEERRKDLVKQVKKMSEEHKLGVREARREALQALKVQESDGNLPADDKKRHEKKVQDLTDDFVKKIDETCAVKEKEILQV
jgi:ribosome recycling factor